METIIGLGNAGCNIAEKFSQYSQYNVYRIDTEKRLGKNFRKITQRGSHEEYEKKCPSFKTFFKNAKPPYLFIVGGGGKISGSCLRIMQQLQSKDIYVLYIKPDTSLFSTNKQLQEKVVFQVLQQYARSNMLQKMYIVNNNNLEKILGDVPIIGYYEKLNDILVSTIHMINIYRNTEPVIKTFSDAHPTAKISTFGMIDVQSGKENLFYPLQMPREKLYYYSIDKKDLQEESSLFKTITKQIKSKLSKNTKVSYGIYANDYGQSYGYTVAHSTLIQEQNINS